MKTKQKYITFKLIILLTIILFSLTGLIASFILSKEYIALLQNPEIHFGCNINSAINCTSVMKSWQAHVFGFPNTLMGLIGYSSIITFGVLLLTSEKVTKYILILANIGVLAAAIFSYWLLFQSVYSISSLCPYCLLSCFSATNIFFSITLLNLNENNFEFKKNVYNKVKSFLDGKFYIPIIVLWYMIIVILVYKEFGNTLFQ